MGALQNCHLGLLAFLLSAQLVAPDTRTCDPGWVQNYNSCYKFEQYSYSPKDGEATCLLERQEAHLVSILSKEEAQFVSTFLMEKNIQGVVRIGLHEKFVYPEVCWTWTDESPLQYEAWAPNEPNVAPFVNDYVVLTREFNYTLWETRIRSYSDHLMCKYRL